MADQPDQPDRQEKQRLLLDAVVAIGADLSLDGVLSRIVTVAGRLVEARYAALGVLGEPENGDGDRLRTFVHHGVSSEDAARIGEVPRGHGILGLIIDRPEPLRLRDLAEHPASYGFPPHHPPMTSFLGVPLRIKDQVFGNLYLCDKADGSDFTADDEEVVVALAAAAGVAVENARMYEDARRREEDRRRIALLEDRDRIGRDLHDLVIQRLFAVGLGLQGTARRADRPDLAERIDQAVDDIDATIKDIRRTIFSLGSLEAGDDVQAEATRIVDRAATTLKFRPTLTFEGPVRTLVGPDLAPDLLAVLGEALSNASRHAMARAVSVRLGAGPEGVALTVADDGRGIDTDAGESGLANIRRRAEARGGSFVIDTGADRGTTLTWTVPVVRPA